MSAQHTVDFRQSNGPMAKWRPLHTSRDAVGSGMGSRI